MARRYGMTLMASLLMAMAWRYGSTLWLDAYGYGLLFDAMAMAWRLWHNDLLLDANGLWHDAMAWRYGLTLVCLWLWLDAYDARLWFDVMASLLEAMCMCMTLMYVCAYVCIGYTENFASISFVWRASRPKKTSRGEFTIPHTLNK